MNKSYRLIYSNITNTWVAVAEHVKARGKRSGGSVTAAATSLATIAQSARFLLKVITTSLLFAGLAHAAPPVNELPTGGQVTAGSASISQSGSTMTINQGTDRAAVNWNTFNVGSGATVNINQPNASSVILNRVMSNNPSQIFGQINANGQVFLSNPSGVYFAPGSSVNVGGIVATTHKISDADFMAGINKFNRDGATGSVINEGDITAAINGYVALMAPEVRNNGVIIAQLGTVALAAGEAYELQFDNNNTLTNIRVEPATIAALVENGNAVQAPGGLILLSSQAVNSLQGGIINNSGTLEASSLNNKGGRIILEGDTITLKTGSEIKATGATGGGTVLVGGDWQGSGDMHQATSVTMEQDASIDVSSTDTGAGGRAVLFADLDKPDSTTTFTGSIFARGGANAGDGGFVETSAANVETGAGFVDTRALKGKTGLWLIDPYNYIIDSTKAGNIVNSLLTTTVAIDTSNTSNASWGSDGNAGGAGNITIGADIVSTSGNSLSFTTTGSIVVNNQISVTGGSAALSLSAGNGIQLGANITTAGSQSYTGAVGLLAPVVLTSNTGGVSFSSTVNSAGAGGDFTYLYAGGSWTTNDTGANKLLYTSGNTFTTPTGVNSVKAWAVGPGGGGAGATASDGSSGGGGGAGGVSYKTWTTSSGTAFSVSTGSGGSGGYDSGNGSNGSQSTITSSGTTITATGGSGGLFNAGSGGSGGTGSGGDGSASGGSGYASIGDNGGGGGGGIGFSNAAAATTSGGQGAVSADVSGLSSALSLVGFAIGTGAGPMPTTNSGGMNNFGGNATGFGSGGSGGAFYGGNGGSGYLGGGGAGAAGYGTSWSGGTGGAGAAVIKFTQSGIAALTINAGSGNVNFGGAVGNTQQVGTLTINTSGTTTFAGNVKVSGISTSNSTTNFSGGGSLEVTGNATLKGTISGVSTVTVGSSGSPGSTNFNALNLTSTGAQNYYGPTTLAGSATLTGTSISLSDTIDLASHGLTLEHSAAASVAGAISGSGGITKNGNGTLTLSGTNTYSGATAINAGSLTNGSAGAIGDSSAVTVASGATWNLANYSDTAGSIAGAGNVTLGSGMLTAGGNNTSTSYSGVISGTGGLAKSGSGTLTLSGIHTYAGATTINAGILALDATGTIAASSGVANSGTFSIAADKTIDSMTGSGATSLGSNTLTIGDASNTTATYSGVISGTGGIIKAGSGTLTLSGANSFTGATTINAGTLANGASGAIADASAVIVAFGATWNLANFNESVASITGAGNISLGSGTLTSGGDNTSTSYSGAISGTGGFTKSGSGTLTLSGTNTYSGTTTISSGMVSIAAANGIGSGAISLGGGTLEATNTIDLGSRAVTLTANSTLSAASIKTLSGGIYSGAGYALTLAGGGNFSLTNTSNNLGNLVGSAVGDLTYSQTNAFTVGTSGGTVGINATGNVALTSMSGGLTLTKGINTTTTGSKTITLKAADDIALTSGIAVNNTSGNGGAVQILAGRSVLINANVDTDKGNLTIQANNLTSGITSAQRDTGAASITMAPGTQLTAGTGLAGETDGGIVDLKIIKTGTAGSTGTIALSKITAGSIAVWANDSSASTKITLLADSQLVASKSYGTTTPPNNAAIVLDGVYRFENNSSLGASALSLTGTNSRWLIYSMGPNDTVKGGLTSSFRKYGKASWNYLPASVTETGNGFIYNTSQGGLLLDTSLSAGTANHVYGNTPTATFSYGLRYMDAEDSTGGITLTGTPTLATAVTSSMNYGNYYIRYGTTGLTASNGAAISVGSGVSYSVSQRPVQISSTKVYDNTTGLPSSSITITNRVGSDSVAFTSTLTGALSSDNVGTYTLSTLPYQNLSNSNYTTVGGTGTATVTPKPLTLTSFNATNKTYDGTTAVVISGATFNSGASSATDGRYYGTDSFSFNTSGVTGSVANKNVGTNKVVTVSGVTSTSLSGTDAGNYTINVSGTLPTALASVFARNVTVTGASGLTKTYDGTAAMASGLSGYTVSSGSNGFVSGDAVSVIGAPVFSQSYAGSSYGVYRGTVALSGSDMGNYNLNWVNGTGNTITKATLTMTALDASKLIGQANPTFNASSYTYSGFVNGETATSVSITGATVTNTQSAATSAGTYTGALVPSISNPSLTNYQLNPVAGKYTIVPADTLLVTLGSTSKVYGNANPTLNLASTAQYVSSTGSVLRNVTLTHTGGGHYTYTDGIGTSGAFDVTTAAGTGSAVGNYTITLSNFTKTGSNFSANSTQNGSIAISQREATLSVTAPSRAYDGTTAISNALVASSTSITSKYGTDDVSITGTGAFTTKDVGSGNKSWDFSSLTLTGLAAGNYYLASNSRSGTTGTITAKSVNWLVDNASSTYGTTATLGTAQLNGAVAGDSISGTVAAYVAGTSTVVTPAARTAVGSYDQKVTGLSGTDAANYVLAGTGNTTGTLSIVTKAITLAPNTITKTYDGATTYSVQAGDLTAIEGASGIVSGDDLTGITLAYADKNAGSGNKTVIASGATISDGGVGNAAGNYTITYANATDGTITPKSINVSSAPTAANKVYDGLTFVTLSGGGLNAGQIVGGDSLTLGMSGAFVDANAGNGKTVNLSYSLGGTSAGNYTLASASGNTTANITTAALTMTANAAAKVLNDTDPTLTARYSGFVNGETDSVLSSLSITRATGEGSGSYTITPSASSSNYTITPQTGSFSIIGAGTLLIRVDNPSSKIYGNALPEFSASSAIYCGNPCSDSSYIKNVTLTRGSGNSYSYDDGLGTRGDFNLTSAATATSSVGNYDVTVSNFNTSGSTTVNFGAQQTQLGYLTVTPLAATLTSSGVSKVYDGTTAVTSGSLSVSNKVGSDAVGASGTGVYADKNVGSLKSYSYSDVTLTGGSAGNYYLSSSSYTGTDGEITPRTLNITFTGQNKVYDGTDVATYTTTDNRMGDDVIGVTGTAIFSAGKNVGTGKAVAVSSIFMTGADANNYSIAGTTASAGAADIIARTLNINYAGVNKTYDGNLIASVTTTDDRISGDTFAISRTAAFTDKNVGNGKAVNVSGVSLSGTDGGNYSVVTTGSTSANITPRILNVSFGAGVNKVYDGTTFANVASPSDDRVLNDVLSTTAYAAFASKDAGTGIAVNVSSVDINGTDSGNYTPLVSGGSLTANITRKALTMTGASVSNKVYNGNTTAAATLGTLAGFVGAETVDAAIINALFANKDVGTGKSATVSYSLADGSNGGLAGNYSLLNDSLTANITPKALTMSGATAADKTYDGNTLATITLGSLVGVVGAENPSVSGVGNFIDPNVGTGKTVNIVLALADTNYTISDTTAIASIIASNVASGSVVPPPPRPPTTETGISAGGGDPLGGADTSGDGNASSSDGTSFAKANNDATMNSNVEVKLEITPSSIADGLVTVLVARSLIEGGAGFSIPLPKAIIGDSKGRDIIVMLEDGKPLPTWMTYNKNKQAIEVKAVPPNGLPIKMLVVADGKRTVIEIAAK